MVLELSLSLLAPILCTYPRDRRSRKADAHSSCSARTASFTMNLPFHGEACPEVPKMSLTDWMSRRPTRTLARDMRRHWRETCGDIGERSAATLARYLRRPTGGSVGISSIALRCTRIRETNQDTKLAHEVKEIQANLRNKTQAKTQAAHSKGPNAGFTIPFALVFHDSAPRPLRVFRGCVPKIDAKKQFHSGMHSINRDAGLFDQKRENQPPSTRAGVYVPVQLRRPG
jgi:hypothetical protein